MTYENALKMCVSLCAKCTFTRIENMVNGVSYDLSGIMQSGSLGISEKTPREALIFLTVRGHGML